MNTEGWEKYDWDTISLLLNVAKESSFHPKFKNITAAALAALDAIANPPPPEEELPEELPPDPDAPASPPDPDNTHLEDPAPPPAEPPIGGKAATTANNVRRV